MTHEKNLTLLLLPHQNVKTYASKYKCVSKNIASSWAKNESLHYVRHSLRYKSV